MTFPLVHGRNRPWPRSARYLVTDYAYRGYDPALALERRTAVTITITTPATNPANNSTIDTTTAAMTDPEIPSPTARVPPTIRVATWYVPGVATSIVPTA